MTTIVCPECGKDDMIQKVSAIYSGGVSTTSYQQPVAIQTKDGTFYGNVDKTAVNSTALAKRLAPPPKPQSPDISGGCALVLLIVGAIAGLIITFSIGQEESQFVSFIFILGIPVILFFLLFKFYINPAQKIYKEKLKPEWDKVQQKWSELYYCSRNDCVFNPDAGKSVPPEKMSTLIY